MLTKLINLDHIETKIVLLGANSPLNKREEIWGESHLAVACRLAPDSPKWPI